MDLGNGRLIPRPTTPLAGASSCLALQEWAVLRCYGNWKKHGRLAWWRRPHEQYRRNETMLAAHVFIQHLQHIAGWSTTWKLQFNGFVMHRTWWFQARTGSILFRIGGNKNRNREQCQLQNWIWRSALCLTQKLPGLQQWEPDRLQTMWSWHLCYKQWEDKSFVRRKFTCSVFLAIQHILATKWPMGWHSWVPRVPAFAPLGCRWLSERFTRKLLKLIHKGGSGYRDILITAAEKVIDRGQQLVVGVPCSEESLWEIHRRRRLLDKKLIWARQAQGVE